MKIRLILNGQKAEFPGVQEAIGWVRQHRFFALDVRTAFHIGELESLVGEASEEGVTRLVFGGGDGTLNHGLNALMRCPASRRPEMAVLPLGTANDFARAAGIPSDLREALLLAVEGRATMIDIGQVNERYFLNVASGGFGAQVTTETSPELKRLLGGSAYAVTGLLKLLNFLPVRGKMRIGEYEFSGSAFATAVCNGRQAGGGMLLAPRAIVNDGKLDIVLFTLDDVEIPEQFAPPAGAGFFPFRKQFRAASVEFVPEIPQRVVNLDGEPYEASRFLFRVLHREFALVLPEKCPLLGGER